MHATRHAGAMLLVLAAGLSPTAPAAETTRDPWLWPFAATSIWNTPIGSTATYVAAGHFTPATWVAADVEIHRKLNGADPLRPVFGASNWTARCADRSQPQNVSVNLPDDFVLDSVVTTGGRYETPNDVAALLRPDGTLVQIEPLARCTAGGDVFGYVNAKGSERLDGAGTYGAHWGSGLSSIGGSLRHGELTGDLPIRHALKLNVPGDLLNYDAGNPETTTGGVVLRGKGYRWPADRNDGGAPGDYKGTDPAVTMGALVAVPPSVTADGLGLRTAPARRLFDALRDYGAYIVDNSGADTRDADGNLTWRQYAFGVGAEAATEFAERQGYAINQDRSAGGAAGDWFADVNKLIGALAVVDDNAPGTVGGSGARRVTTPIPPLGASDTQAPSVPTGLAVTGTTHSTIDLSWQPATDNVRIMGYEVLEGGRVVARTAGRTSVTVGNLQPQTSYAFTIRAVDTNRNTSAVSATLTTGTVAGYSEDFNGGTANGWSMPAGVTAQNGQLRLTGWSADRLASILDVSWSQPYAVSMTARTDAQDDGGKTRLLFNHNGSDYTYFVEFGGGTANTVRLGKRIGGIDTTIATSPVSYTLWQGDPARITVRYADDGITVSAARDGVATTLFDAVGDYSLSSGRIGVEVGGTQTFVDDVTVEAG